MVSSQEPRESRNGAPRHASDWVIRPRRHGIVKRSFGFAMVMLMLFRFFMTWLLNLTPDPMLSSINLAIGIAGITLILLARREDRDNTQR